MSVAATIMAAAAKICFSITSSRKYEGRPAHIRWMDNCEANHSFADGDMPRAFVMQDEALFILRLTMRQKKKPARGSRAGLDDGE
jgi:hypothetical protein